jgi:hypothetical protein
MASADEAGFDRWTIRLCHQVSYPPVALQESELTDQKTYQVGTREGDLYLCGRHPPAYRCAHELNL